MIQHLTLSKKKRKLIEIRLEVYLVHCTVHVLSTSDNNEFVFQRWAMDAYIVFEAKLLGKNNCWNKRSY
jgi:hypothetical protein